VRVDADELKRITRDVIAAGDAYDTENQSGAECDVQFALEDAGLTPPDAWANASTSITRTSNPERMAVYLTRAPGSAGNTAEIVERLEWAWGRFVFNEGAYTIRESSEAVRMDFATWWEHGGFYTGRVKVIPSRPAKAASVRLRTDRDRPDARAAYSGVEALCAFCGVALDSGVPGSLWLAVGSDRTETTQGFYVHGTCMAARLQPQVPFLPSTFEPDDPE
jgi:hypothetical protein